MAPKNSPSGTCNCRVNSKDDTLTFEISVTNQSNEAWPDCWGWLCFIHCWAQAFQANCELPVGEPENPWIPVSTLEAPLGRWLKWCPVAEYTATAERIARKHKARWQPHIQASSLVGHFGSKSNNKTTTAVRGPTASSVRPCPTRRATSSTPRPRNTSTKPVHNMKRLVRIMFKSLFSAKHYPHQASRLLHKRYFHQSTHPGLSN